MSMWGKRDFGQVAIQFLNGGTPETKVSEYWDGDIPWITGADIINQEVKLGRRYITKSGLDNSASNMAAKGSLLLVTRTGVGKVAIAPCDLAISQDLTAVILPKLISPKFAFYWWLSLTSDLKNKAQGAIIKGLTRRDVERLPFPEVSYREQERIVEILDQANTLRRQRAVANTQASRLLPALFRHYFGDLLSNPKLWKTKRLVDLCKSEDDIKCGPFGTQLKKSEFTDFGVPLWGIKHVNKLFKLETDEFLSVEKSEELSDYDLIADDIVMTRKGTIGNCAIYPSEFSKGIMHSDLLRIRIDQSQCAPKFLTAQLHYSPSIFKQITDLSHGAIMAGINVTKLKQIHVHVPPIELQERFAGEATTLEKIQAEADKSTEKFETLFQVLLQRAFDGRLTAKWREAHAAELLREMEFPKYA